METKIWKFELLLLFSKRQSILIPHQAEILSVQVQNQKLCIWARVIPEAPKATRTFTIFATGQTIPRDFLGTFLETVQTNDGALVWHVFETLNP